MDSNSLLCTLAGTPVFLTPAGEVLWTGALQVDGDGSPRCYHPESWQGLDRLANAGRPGEWFGLATDPHGKPFIQGIDAPIYGPGTEGFYVSTTALAADASRAGNDPRRYVNAETVPYVVIPAHFPVRGLLGKLATVLHTATGKQCEAIVADVGPADSIGEGSIALARALGIDADCRHGGVTHGVQVTIHCGGATATGLMRTATV